MAVKSGFVNCFNFKGRATRAEYWYFILFLNCLLYPIIFYGPSLLFQIMLKYGFMYYIIASAAPYILTVYFVSTVTVRRLHDINKTGWWVLLQFIPLINLIAVTVFIFWFCKKGTPGENNYGPPSTALERK